MSENSELLLLDDVARRCRAPVSTVRYWIAIGKLPSGRFGRRRVVRRDDLERFIAAGFRPTAETAAASRGEVA
jgi:excisionase family DNA binding protein